MKWIIHTDGLPWYGISEKEIRKLKNFVKTKDDDCVVIIVGEREKALQALKEFVNRVKQTFDGVSKEVELLILTGQLVF